ncbi:polynucleotide 5'-hydroxyl-kinase NOL9-like isoform X2 [Trifolium pratense]|uniref:polynucleotide 5'-hydroxyl-kinase NOL9-like isoform X2 n=1 Tax=Trifolium pratense TaxID=57577 RepID=UPI001E693FEE|nr:polynucleotide 5'-hydroxyl-kinase NOL9-like isoform X2 [Trifolium pratense]
MDSYSSPDIYIPEQWSEAANSIAYNSMPPITVICGPKNCGKTTFSRYLVNLLLTKWKKVAYFDIDVGQPEFTPPGLISLTNLHQVTPDLTSQFKKTPKRSLFFGDVSPKRDPSAYLKYICSIYDYYQKEYCTFDKGHNSSRSQTPLVVNTSGWVKGVGYEVLVDTLKYICPTHIVKIGIPGKGYANKNLPAGEFWLDGEDDDGTSKLIEIKSARHDSNRPQCFPSDSDISTVKELAHSLTSLCPYQVPIASIKIQHVHREVPSSEIFYSLNASIVGFAVESDEPENLPWCLGLGIVRGIDTVKGMLYVITPVPYDSLKKVNLLLQGYIQIPTHLIKVKGCISPYMSENVLTRELGEGTTSTEELGEGTTSTEELGQGRREKRKRKKRGEKRVVTE